MPGTRTRLGKILLVALKAFVFYVNPRNWVQGVGQSSTPEPTRMAMKSIAYSFVPECTQNLSLAPWTDDQVLSLNGYQECCRYHPFTYGEGEDKVALIATNDGWVAYNEGPVVQVWAHRWMADWSWDLKPSFPM